MTAALLAVLGTLVACGGDPGPTATHAAEPAAADDLPGGAPAPPPVAHPATGSWTAPLSDTVRRWKRVVTEHTGGKVPASRVDVAVHVRRVGDRVELAELRADAAHTPASNMKLVTTAAALVLLGPGLEFLTPVEAVGPVEGGVLRGDLVVRASGDPVCAPDGDARVEHRFAKLASDLAATGLTRVTGDLVLDEGTFAAPEPGPAWPDPGQHWQEYCALAGGFTVNGGVLQALVTPGRKGGPASIEVHPRPHGLRESYGVETRGRALDVRVGATRSAATVRGAIPAGRDTFVAEFAHPDPVQLFGTVLRDQLERAGIHIDGETRRERGAPAGERLAELRSPVDDVLGPINADSRNAVADQLFYALGHTVTGAGTRAGGSEATRLALARLGVPTSGFVQVDGSGLSRDNRVSARQITELVGAVLAKGGEAAALYRDSLAVAGETGTLARRLRDSPGAGRVRAKTGWISGASSISGVLETLDGEELVFSILVGYPASAGGLNTRCFKPMQDEILDRLVREAR